MARLDLSDGVNGANFWADVDGNSGDDTIAVTLGSLTAAHVGLDLDGGRGNDNISVSGAAVADSVVSPAQATTGSVNISADSTLRLDLDGGKGNDNLSVNLQGQILGKLSVSEDGGKGTDTLVTNITADSGSTGKVRAFSAGGKGVDNVTLNVFDNSGSSGASTLAALHATIFDPGSVDTLTHTDNVTVITDHGHHHGWGHWL